MQERDKITKPARTESKDRKKEKEDEGRTCSLPMRMEAASFWCSLQGHKTPFQGFQASMGVFLNGGVHLLPTGIG